MAQLAGAWLSPASTATQGSQQAVEPDCPTLFDALRLERATGVILLDTPTGTSLYRYLRRTWFERVRHGALAGGRDSIKWAMTHHIAVTTRASRRRYEALFRHLRYPKVRLATTQELARFYRSEGLDWQ